MHYSNDFTTAGLNHLATALHDNKTLTFLRLASNSLEDVDAQHLSNVLRQNKVLTILKLQDNRIGDAGAKYLANALENNTVHNDRVWPKHYTKTITALYLESNNITFADDGVQHLTEALQNNTTLTVLDLANADIRVKGAQYLADLLISDNTKLSRLYLKNNSVEDVGSQHLGNALRKNQTLNTFLIGSNPFGHYEARRLADALAFHTVFST
ncbi:unnamed protein product [Adineta ricciae]|uniref:Uncharacterized protein n=1 Tax=Adineta ricciae TaxID=249248 RepID=A0A815JLZ1_ADIRI|nr:unnamed protein product [Adineta ricciae]